MNASALLTLPDWAHAYAAGETTHGLLGRLRRQLETESPPGVWITLVDAPGLAAQLAALDERVARVAADSGDTDAARRALPLYGVPFAVKDNIDVAGMRTTAACPAFARVAEANAHVVGRLAEAGAICMGKTNLDQFATGLVGTRSPYGRPSSTFAADRISGGSSSGSAVAVSLGLVPFALGTDTAGSGRVPAAFNNVVGCKPTPGRVGNGGIVPACRSIDCVAVFALTVADAAEVLAVIEGPDAGDAYSAFVAGPAALPRALRIGIPSQAAFSGDAGYGPAFERAVGQAASLGHTVVPVDFAPLHEVASLLYEGPWVAERQVVAEALLRDSPGELDPSVRTVLEAARSMSASDAFRGLYRLQEARLATTEIWAGVDLLMVPSTPGHPRFDEVDAEPIAVNARLGTYTNFVNLLGWCALAVPAGMAAHGLPFGVTFIAPAASDAALARFGVAWQAGLELPLGATGLRASQRPADDGPAVERRWPASEATLPIAVVGAHLSGLPLNHQLVDGGARLREKTTTAASYRLFALPNTRPARPGLLRVVEGGAAVAVEVWEMPTRTVGAFVAGIAAPLGLGSVELISGERVHGFLCEAHALAGAADITAFGGWRAYLDRASRHDPSDPEPGSSKSTASSEASTTEPKEPS